MRTKAKTKKKNNRLLFYPIKIEYATTTTSSLPTPIPFPSQQCIRKQIKNDSVDVCAKMYHDDDRKKKRCSTKKI